MLVPVDPFVGRFLGRLANFVFREICKVLGVEEEVEKLKMTLARIRPYLPDADRRRHEDVAIDTFLIELKDIMYDAEDIMDDCMLEGGQLRLEPHPSSFSSSNCWSIVSLPYRLLSSCSACTKNRHEIAYRVEELNGRLKKIVEDRQITSLLVPSTSKSTQHLDARCRETTPLEVEDDIVGIQIEQAAEDLIEKILNYQGNKKCAVFGIVGMGGIGKTTLARKIYNDKRIKNKFLRRAWLSVSNNYSELGLLRKLVKDAGGNDDGAEGLQELEAKVVSILDNNYFIVLDDVWSVKVWSDLLRNPIVKALANGKVLVTSRDENILESMKAIYRPAERMNESDAWKLLCKIVFEDEDSKGYGLDEVGLKIIKLCDGLPLAIKVIAGVLVSKEKTWRDWQTVLKSDIWHMKQKDADIPKALYLSYKELPSDLKECFLSCALYNGVSCSPDLMRLWVAEGLIAEQVDADTLMEEVAQDKYKQLLRRSLLQPYPGSANKTIYSMHDLLRSLATNLIGEEGIVLTDAQIPNTNPLTKIRRLSLSSKGEILTLPSTITEQKCLRVLHLSDCYDTKTIEVGLLERLQYLRILDIRETQIDSLPDSLFGLVRLRYLDLDRTAIREMPEAIGRLTNLLTLNISGCKSLFRLPDGITKLRNLRCLRVSGSPLTHLPKEIGRLTNLNHVERFVIGRDEDDHGSMGCDLEDLQSFPNMRFLEITRLERATATGTTVLGNRAVFLRHLCLEWTRHEGQRDGGPSTEEQIERAEKICEELVPPSTTEDLRIYNFPGRLFPDWIVSTTTLGRLTYLQLWDCSSCRDLPPLGRLPHLKYLHIKGAEAIETIGHEFPGCSSPTAPAAFPKLEILTFENMLNWEEWWLCEGQKDEELKLLFPTLQECTLSYCPKLREIPENLYRAANLKNIFVSSSDEYARREYSKHHSSLILVHDPVKGRPDWLPELLKEEEMEAAPSAPLKIFYKKSW